jgi:hypothetical protein
LADWQTLNPTERYFALFQAWWLRGNGKMLDSINGSQNLYRILMFFKGALDKPPKGKALTIDLESLRYTPGLLNLVLMELFGFIRITLAPHLTGETWPIIGIEPSDWGGGHF